MTKGAKKTGGLLRRSARRVPKRTPQGRSVKTKILIIGEGRETEPNYFRRLTCEDAVRDKSAVTVKRGPGGFAGAVVEKAIEEKERAEKREEAFDEVRCVLDVEGPRKRAELDRAVALAKKNSIEVCLSNPSFEVWLLSHFEETARPYRDSSAVVAQLNKHWRKCYGQDYRKNDERIYDRLRDLTEDAIRNARRVREEHHSIETPTADCNSSTDVYRLVKRLMG